MEMNTKIDGLPVKGYKPQSERAIATVNANKAMEELLLRLCDVIAMDALHDEDFVVDMRWHSIAVSHFQQGFMALNRSVFNPERITNGSIDALYEDIKRGFPLSNI
jgi:hypothetical protein